MGVGLIVKKPLTEDVVYLDGENGTPPEETQYWTAGRPASPSDSVSGRADHASAQPRAA